MKEPTEPTDRGQLEYVNDAKLIRATDTYLDLEARVTYLAVRILVGSDRHQEARDMCRKLARIAYVRGMSDHQVVMSDELARLDLAAEVN